MSQLRVDRVLARAWVLVHLGLELGAHPSSALDRLSKGACVLKIVSRAWLLLFGVKECRPRLAPNPHRRTLLQDFSVSLVVVTGTWVRIDLVSAATAKVDLLSGSKGAVRLGVGAGAWRLQRALAVGHPEVLPLRSSDLTVALGCHQLGLITVVLARARVQVLLGLVLGAHRSCSFHVLANRVSCGIIIAGSRLRPLLLGVPEVGPRRRSDLAVRSLARLHD